MTRHLLKQLFGFAAILLAGGLVASSGIAAPMSPVQAVDTLPLCPAAFKVESFPFTYRDDDTLPVSQLSAEDPSIGSDMEFGRVRTIFTVNTVMETIQYGTLQCRQLHITAGYKNAVVSVAKELVNRPCEYEHVKTHELTHASIYVNYLYSLSDNIQNALDAAFKGKGFHASNDDIEKARGIAARLTDAVLKEQRDFDDSGESYRLMSACDGHMRNLVKNIRQRQ